MSLLEKIQNLNILDLIILIVLIFYGFEGYALGFMAAFFDFLSFILSFFLGLKFYSLFGKLLIQNFSLPLGIANAFGFFITAFIAEIILNLFFKKIYSWFYRLFISSDFLKRTERLNHLLGILPGLASALILISFLLTIIISLPFSPFLKNLVSSSKFGSALVLQTSGFEKGINDIFGGAINETLNFLTVEPKSNELVFLNFKATSFKTDETAEKRMFLMVNKERTSRGLSPLVFDESLREVARLHGQDMFSRGYFSHYTPEGLSPFDRMVKANISFTYAGENLAFAPNVDLAMQGLMQSEGHRANILSPNFGKIGIGVIDGGMYGEMFAQEFTD